MRIELVRVHPSKDQLPSNEQLAWKLAEVAVDAAPFDDEVVQMVVNRVIDNAAVSCAGWNYAPVVAARTQAIAHPDDRGAKVFGVANGRFAAEWAAWANAVAVRQLDFHDTFLAQDYAHPGDSIAPILAVAQRMGCSGADFVRGVVAAYEVHVALVKGICLHEHRIDHIAHTAPAAAAGIGALLSLDTRTVYQAIQQSLHVCTTTRQSRKGAISTWKAFAPGHAGKLAVEAVDRAMRGETCPEPAYEGEDGFIAWLLSGPDALYSVPLPDIGEPRCAILETYTKEHAAEYQSQALIDLAVRLHSRIEDLTAIASIEIETSHHTHFVIGTGSRDPQKSNPASSRETLDHSITYIFAVSLEDGEWHHERSYSAERARRPDTVVLWHKIMTRESKRWTELYHHSDPSRRCFGGKVTIRFDDGSELVDEIGVANAHPNGAQPFGRDEYVRKFRNLSEGVVAAPEAERFLARAASLQKLDAQELLSLNLAASEPLIKGRAGIFDAA